MTPNGIEHGFWYYNWGNVASVVGSIVSLAGFLAAVVAARAAESAKDAANRARESANVRILVDEVIKGETLSRELANHLDARNLSEAVLRAKDLNELLSWMLAYWTDMDASWRNSLFEAKNDSDQILKGLRKNVPTDVVSDREVTKAIVRIDTIHTSFTKVRAGLEQRRS